MKPIHLIPGDTLHMTLTSPEVQSGKEPAIVFDNGQEVYFAAREVRIDRDDALDELTEYMRRLLVRKGPVKKKDITEALTQAYKAKHVIRMLAL